MDDITFLRHHNGLGVARAVVDEAQLTLAEALNAYGYAKAGGITRVAGPSRKHRTADMIGIAFTFLAVGVCAGIYFAPWLAPVMRVWQ